VLGVYRSNNERKTLGDDPVVLRATGLRGGGKEASQKTAIRGNHFARVKKKKEGVQSGDVRARKGKDQKKLPN